MNAIHHMHPATGPAAVAGAVSQPGLAVRMLVRVRAYAAWRRELAIRNALMRRELNKKRYSEAGLRQEMLRECLRLGQ